MINIRLAVQYDSDSARNAGLQHTQYDRANRNWRGL